MRIWNCPPFVYYFKVHFSKKTNEKTESPKNFAWHCHHWLCKQKLICIQNLLRQCHANFCIIRFFMFVLLKIDFRGTVSQSFPREMSRLLLINGKKKIHWLLFLAQKWRKFVIDKKGVMNRRFLLTTIKTNIIQSIVCWH